VFGKWRRVRSNVHIQGRKSGYQQNFNLVLAAHIPELAATVQIECGTIRAGLTDERPTAALGAETVPVRLILILGAAVALAGCANDRGGNPLAIQAANASMLGGPVPTAVADADLKRAATQTMSAKMLAAIALERVTGRTPDPARFSELR
jgi:hypothetical protein